ncbi:MAG: hypothetical protein ABIG11_02415 [bacterium]
MRNLKELSGRLFRRLKKSLTRGVVLLQTLIMAVILAMIGAMTLKWTLGRHALVSQGYKSTVARAETDYCQAYAWAQLGTAVGAVGTGVPQPCPPLQIDPVYWFETVGSAGSPTRMEIKTDDY